MKLNLSPAALAAVTLLLGACAANDPAGPADQTVKHDEVRYLRIAIANPPSSTRADATFQDGTPEENAVKSLYFKFYDASGAPIETENMTLEKNSDGNIPFDPVTPANSSAGKIKEVVVQISLKRGAKYPAYVMCFINPVDYSELGTGSSTEAGTNDHEESLYHLRDHKRPAYKDNSGAFAMNNSVYYGNDPISGANNVKMTGAPILVDQLYATEEAAKEGTASAVTIYVERYAAKVNFSLNQGEGAIKDYVTANGYKLQFSPEAWTINADAPEMYAVKRFENSLESSTGIPSYGDVQAMLGTWDTWNAPTLFRSYWACSPAFYATEFPQVSDNIIDLEPTVDGKVTTGAGIAVAPYALKYYSYNQITSPSSTSTGKGVTAFNNADKKVNWKYVLENTMGKAAFESLNPKAAAPSVLLVGHYDISDGTSTLNVPKGFCLYNNNLYFNETVPTGALTGSTTILKALLDANMILATDQNGTLLKSTSLDNFSNLASYFTVEHPAKAIRGTQAVPHRYVTLQLKSDLTAIQNLYYKPTGSETWVALAATETQTLAQLIEHINLLLWQQIGVARAYTENKCYFSIPIQHLGITENVEATSPIGEEGVIDWKKVRVGDFGLVRNHVYSIEVDGIDGLASGIESLDNPIVPAMDETDYWVKYRINILNWRVVPTQGGIILK